MRVSRVFGWVSAMGAAAQASVPGLYAWASTVAPAAWSRGSSVPSKVAALLALGALVGGVAWEARGAGTQAAATSAGRARFLFVWAFVIGSALTWSAAPVAMGSLRVDTLRGLAGMVGWALFALASAAPALQPRMETVRLVEGDPLVARNRLAAGDVAYVVAGGVGAIVLQGVGWRIASPERALLVRFVAIAAGLAVVGAGTDLALARHGRRSVLPAAPRLRRALSAFVVLGMLAVTGALFALRG